MKFLKALGLGIVYMLISPFIVVGAVCYMLYGLGRWFIFVPVGIIRYFKGEKFFKPLKEDIEVDAAIKAYHDSLLAKETEEPQPPVQPVNNTNTTTYVQNNYYTNPNQQPMGPGLNAPMSQQLGAPQYQNPQLINQQYQQPMNQPLNPQQYQELPTISYQQVSAEEAESLFDNNGNQEDDEYTESSIDNPIKVPEEGGDDQ